MNLSVSEEIETLTFADFEYILQINDSAIHMINGDGPSVDILTDDSDGGTINLYNQSGPLGVTISLVGNTGTGYFAGGITAARIKDKSLLGIGDILRIGADGELMDTGIKATDILTTSSHLGGDLSASSASATVTAVHATSGSLDGVTIGSTKPEPATFATVTSGSYIGPVSAPTGSCPTNGAWVFSQDGHATFCASGTWVTKI